MTQAHFESKFKILLLNQLVIAVLNNSARCDGARALSDITVPSEVFYVFIFRNILHTLSSFFSEEIESLYLIFVQAKVVLSLVSDHQSFEMLLDCLNDSSID